MALAHRRPLLAVLLLTLLTLTITNGLGEAHETSENDETNWDQDEYVYMKLDPANYYKPVSVKDRSDDESIRDGVLLTQDAQKECLPYGRRCDGMAKYGNHDGLCCGFNKGMRCMKRYCGIKNRPFSQAKYCQSFNDYKPRCYPKSYRRVDQFGKPPDPLYPFQVFPEK